MIAEFLREQATLYIAGSLSPDRVPQFELLLRCHEELRHFTASLAEASAPLLIQSSPGPLPEGFKDRVMASLPDFPQSLEDALVMSDPKARVQWVSPAFTEMCGYTLAELKGEKLGPLLQGEKTDPEACGRLRSSIENSQTCREIILNYHKDGHPYWVEIVITPITNDQGELYCFIAQEYERPDISLP